MQLLETLKHGDLVDLLNEYDKYIQTANEENYFINGWRPVCLAEFFDNEYQEILESRAAGT